MLVSIAGATNTAKAHMIWHRKHQTFAQKVYHANATIFHARRMIAWSKKHKTLLVHTVGRKYYKTLLRDHKWLLKYGLLLKQKLYLQTLPAHYQGWICIHNREGAWNSQTGNGFYGGLQMTYGWMGLVRGNAAWLSPLQQMQAAERGYRNSGYSHSWMSGQWPNTYPPCANYF